MKQIFWYLGASVLLLSGCKNTKQMASEPAPQRITEATPIIQATPSANGEAAVSGVAPKKLKSVSVFDINKFHLARTLELPYYNDEISGFVFSPDGKTVAGVGRGRILSNTEGGERGVVFLFDVKSGALLKRLASDALPAANGLGPSFDRAAWSPDGKSVVAWNTDSGGGTGRSLCVWDIEIGQRTAVFRNARLSVTNAAWMNDGLLLVARSDITGNLNINSQLMICNGQTGQINNVYDLGNKSVASIHVPHEGLPQLLVLTKIGERKASGDFLVQSSVRSFSAGALSQPLIQFKPGEAFLSAAFSEDGRVALSGIEQGNPDPTAALYALGDVNARQIVWQSKKDPIDFSLELSLSPDNSQFFACTLSIRDDLSFEMANGKSLSSEYPFFAPDGKRFVRLAEGGKRGQKPNLKIAEIWER